MEVKRIVAGAVLSGGLLFGGYEVMQSGIDNVRQTGVAEACLDDTNKGRLECAHELSTEKSVSGQRFFSGAEALVGGLALLGGTLVGAETAMQALGSGFLPRRPQ